MNSKQNIISYGRFKGAPWFDSLSQSTIFVGGAGTISSWLVLQLARTGANIIVLDPQNVGEENLAGQTYGPEDIGKPKVQAIVDVVKRLCSQCNLTPLQETITEDYGAWRALIQRCEVVCVGFDNLPARRLVYEEWKTSGKEKSLFVDGRLSFENGEVFTLEHTSTSEQFLAYEQTYFPESERVEMPCSMKATTHCGSLIASFMVSQITNWFNNQLEDVMPRAVGNVEFHLPLMILDTPILKPKEEYVN